MRRREAVPFVCSFATLVGVFALQTPAGALAPQACPGWSQVSAPNGTLFDVGVISQRDAWAVGARLQHWDGETWSLVPDPLSNVPMFGVSAVSSTDVWAAGANSRATILHWDGTAWSVAPSPGAGPLSFLQDIDMIDASDGWAVGWSSTNSGVDTTLTEHWDGTAWSIVPSPNSGPHDHLLGVDAVASNDVWAVGDWSAAGSPARPLVLHWDGTTSPRSPSTGTVRHGRS